MKLKHFFTVALILIATNLSAIELSTLKQISEMLTPVECSVSNISTTAIGAANAAKKTMEISEQLNSLKSQAKKLATNKELSIIEKLQMLQTAQQIIKGAKSQTQSISKLLSNTKKFAPMINELKEPAKKLAAKKSAEYCTKLMGLCKDETKSQINTAKQILKILKESR